MDHGVEHERHAEDDEGDDGVFDEALPAGFEVEDAEAEFERTRENPKERRGFEVLAEDSGEGVWGGGGAVDAAKDPPADDEADKSRDGENGEGFEPFIVPVHAYFIMTVPSEFI